MTSVPPPSAPVAPATDDRDEFSPATKELLAKRAGYLCAFPGCRRLTVGPSEDRASGLSMLGVAAHITAASPRGPRYDPGLSSEERSSERNGVWACQTHGKLIDDNPSVHTVEAIRRWKKQHEEWVFSRIANAENYLKDGISRISIKDVGPFGERVDIKLGRHNVVYGLNEAGKSTLCEAIAAFSSRANYDRFANRFNFCRGSQRDAMIKAMASRDDASTTVQFSQHKLAVRRAKRLPPAQRLHVEINGNVAASWPHSLFNVVLLNGDIFRSREGPKEPLPHAMWFLSEQLNVDEQTMWDSLHEQLFVTSTFGYRATRTSMRKVGFLVPDGRDFYLPFAGLSGGEQVFAIVDILLKALRADPRIPPWLLAFDTGFFGHLDTSAKQYLFDTLTSNQDDLPLQTIFCVNFENDAETLRAAANDTWIGADSAGKLPVHAFL
jgi:hypothetical protein